VGPSVAHRASCSSASVARSVFVMIRARPKSSRRPSASRLRGKGLTWFPYGDERSDRSPCQASAKTDPLATLSLPPSLRQEGRGAEPTDVDVKLRGPRGPHCRRPTRAGVAADPWNALEAEESSPRTQRP
jgi:hypothetical protein